MDPRHCCPIGQSFRHTVGKNPPRYHGDRGDRRFAVRRHRRQTACQRACFRGRATISSNSVRISPHRATSAANDFLARLITTGQPLEEVLRGPILRGLLTGLNGAFYIQTSLRNAMVRADPGSEHLFKRFLRGRDVKRWVPVWEDQWHIVIPSIQNRTWPWSNVSDEVSAAATF